MANVNLSTSPETDIYIDTEQEYLKMLGHKVVKVDLINYIFSEILNDSKLSQEIRDKLIDRLEKIKIEKEERIKSITRGEK